MSLFEDDHGLIFAVEGYQVRERAERAPTQCVDALNPSTAGLTGRGRDGHC